jgi:hypothetical protein
LGDHPQPLRDPGIDLPKGTRKDLETFDERRRSRDLEILPHGWRKGPDSDQRVSWTQDREMAKDMGTIQNRPGKFSPLTSETMEGGIDPLPEVSEKLLQIPRSEIRRNPEEHKEKTCLFKELLLLTFLKGRNEKLVGEEGSLYQRRMDPVKRIGIVCPVWFAIKGGGGICDHPLNLLVDQEGAVRELNRLLATAINDPVDSPKGPVCPPDRIVQKVAVIVNTLGDNGMG